MRKIVIFLISISFLIIINTKIQIQAEDDMHEPPETSAVSAVLMESHSGRVLYDKDKDVQRPIASISKIMTAILAIEYGYLDDTVTISKDATLQIGSSVYLKPGDEVSLRDLVYALMLRSGNDAAWAIAEYIGGDVDNFVLLMNEKAKALGMHHSIFENPHGLDETTKNISTAYDMALLTKYAMNNPLFREITGEKVHKTKIGDRYVAWYNKHRLVNEYDYVISGKTGFTKLAKRTLVSVAKKGDMELVVVTLNDGNDWEDHLNLFQYGFEVYELYYVARKGVFEVPQLNQIYYLDENIIYPIKSCEMNLYKIVIDTNEEDDTTYLLLVKDQEVVLKREVIPYDSSHSFLKNQFNIVDLFNGIIDFVRELIW